MGTRPKRGGAGMPKAKIGAVALFMRVGLFAPGLCLC